VTIKISAERCRDRFSAKSVQHKKLLDTGKTDWQIVKIISKFAEGDVA
jgi:hypothetical protein